MRPEPAEGSSGEERVDKPVDRRADGRTPLAAIPDRRRPDRERVAHERGRADDLENLGVGRARRQRPRS